MLYLLENVWQLTPYADQSAHFISSRKTNYKENKNFWIEEQIDCICAVLVSSNGLNLMAGLDKYLKERS